tara:strand:+ start:820 stop:1236 length:417 start_codon:yes stop_codon:yes gene_type:complete
MLRYNTYLHTKGKHMNSTIALLTKHRLQNTMWGKRIIAARARGHWNGDDDAKAGSWQSCACGQMDPWIEKGRGGGFSKTAPVDKTLFDLGCEFAYLWEENEDTNAMFDRSAKLLIDIHNRSIELYNIAVQEGKEWATQ